MHTTSIKPLSSLERRLRFKLSEDEINDRFERNAEELAQEARLPGFRPGKVPRSLIKDRYRDGILKNIHTLGIREAMEFAENLDDFDVWKITHADIDHPDDLSQTEYIVDFVVRPVLDLSQLESLILCDPKISADEDCLNRSGSLYRFERAIGSEVDRPIQTGDRVIVEIEDIASNFTGDIRSTYAEWAQDYLGKHQVVIEKWLYDDDLLGSVLHDELLNRSTGEEFEFDAQISNVPLSAFQQEDEELVEDTDSINVNEAADTVLDDSTEDSTQTELVSSELIFSWLDLSRLPLRHLHVKVKILKVEEISNDAVNEGFFARDDVPYKNLEELNNELTRYVEGTIQQGTRDAKQAQVAAQICAMNPVDLPYRILVGEQHAPLIEDHWSDLGATFVPDKNGLKPSLLTRTYFGILEGLFIRQYAEEHSLQPTDDLIAEYTRVEYERLSKLGLDSDRVFDPEYQNLVRNNVMRTRVMNDIFERNSVPEVSVSFFDFYYLSRSGMWSLPPDGGPFSWTAPASSEEIAQTLEAEKRAKELKEASESVDDHSALVNPNLAEALEESELGESQGNAFTNWFRNKFRRSNVTKTNDEE
ncbi:MAG: hypothetical protein F4W92_02840 [Gammaproteobacteria bacterium]|nr:hypothetical protein [Gammaproteobacteria bacterium]